MSDLKIEGQTSIETADLLSISEAIKELKDCPIVICPDTNVLLQMVQSENNMGCISQLNAWLEQMKHCKDLLDNQKVGWLIPEQVKREFVKHKQKRFETSNSFMDKLKSNKTDNKNIINKINEVNHIIEELCKKLKSNIDDNWNAIDHKSIILKENETSVYEAWELLYRDKFPNEKKQQQMKDTVIL